MKIRITRDKKCFLCVFILYYVIFIGFFTFNFGVSDIANYVPDVLLVLLLLLSIYRIKAVFRMRELAIFFAALILLLISGTFSALVQSFNLGMWAWSLRNWGRMFAFFCVCAVCVNKRELDSVLGFMVRLYDINFFIILAQFFFRPNGIGQDQLNGLFGRNTSVINTAVSSVVFCIAFSGFLSRKMSRRRFAITLIEINIVAILAELKGLLVFEVILTVMYSVANLKISGKNILKYIGILAMVLVIVTIGANLLIRVYPQFEGFFSIEGIIAGASTVGGYGNAGAIDRLTAIPAINRIFFNASGVGNKLFGIGMGNGEYSAYEALTSAFYKQYGERVRYLNFTSATLYLETGLVGLTLFSIALVSLWLQYYSKVRRIVKSNRFAWYENIGLGCAMINVLFIIYGNTHRTEGSLIFAFFLAIPLIVKRESLYEENTGLARGSL